MRDALADLSSIRRRADPRRLAGVAVAPQLLGQARGFSVAACATGSDPRTYTASNHAVQREVHAILENLAGSKIYDKSVAIDGCSVPTLRFRLLGLRAHSQSSEAKKAWSLNARRRVAVCARRAPPSPGTSPAAARSRPKS